MKILVTSDNHLGYKERDPIRGNDTFNTFEEIIKIGKRENVDFILQGGDLFDENRPSRNTYNNTLKLLKKYCIGNNNCINDKNGMKINSKIEMNLDDKKIGICMPILSIHGNHDDPTGFNSVSPLDVLHSSGLLNYFGKCNDYNKIVIDPILIEKDKFKIALYGLGHIKDRIVYRTFVKGNVKFNKPEGDDWFNIFIVHQNRTPRTEEYLPVDLIDSFIDLVIFGHEHESLRIYNNKFEIIQCGSTVITSLSEGEQFTKNVYILDFEDENIIKKIKLKTTRPFVMDDIKIDNGDWEIIIKKKLEKMLINAKEMCDGNESMLPLVRLRVDIGRGISFNRNRLNGYLNNRIANPGDVIKFMKKYEKKEIVVKKVVEKNGINEIYKLLLGLNQLNVLIAPRVVETLNEFVEKNIKDAWTNMISGEISNIIDNINYENIILEDIENIIKETKNRIEKKEYCFIKEDNVKKGIETGDIINNKRYEDKNNVINNKRYEDKNNVINNKRYEDKNNVINNKRYEDKISDYGLTKKTKLLTSSLEFDQDQLNSRVIKNNQNDNSELINDQLNSRIIKNNQNDNSELINDQLNSRIIKNNQNDNSELINIPSSSHDFTFLEDKREKIENEKILEECQTYFGNNKKNKQDNSDDDLLDYTKYI